MEHDRTSPPTPESPDPGVPALTAADDDAPPVYDPADYRWVPVRRRPRVDGWTEEKQRRFIETLADTGLVGAAVKAVGMSRESAYRLRRSAHGAAFAEAWDVARAQAGGLIEDLAFDRAIEGVEHDVFNDAGEVVGGRLQHDNGLLKWLLAHLKPERYGARGEARSAAPEAPVPALAESLRAMEPALPAPPEQLRAPAELNHELHLADVADGVLPHFLREQRPAKTPAQVKAEQAAERDAHGAAAWAKQEKKLPLTQDEFADLCFAIDPISNQRRRRKPRSV